MANSKCCRGSCGPTKTNNSSTSTLIEKSPSTASNAKHNNLDVDMVFDPKHKLRLCVQGMDCGSCAADISRLLSNFGTGILKHTISLVDSKLQVTFDDSEVSKFAIISAIEAAGYPCQESTDTIHDSITALTKAGDRKTLRQSFFLAAFCSFLMYVFSWLAAHYHSALKRTILPGLYFLDLVSLCLMVPILSTTGQIYMSAFSGARSKRVNSNTLVACAIMTSLGYSVLALVVSICTSAKIKPDTFFETVGELTSFTLLGRWMEMAACAMTTSGISTLLQLQPARATRIDAGVEKPIDAALLTPCDICIVRSNERFPADCRIIEGTASVDESAISGDFLPRVKEPGDSAFAGTLNLSGTVKCEVLEVGMNTHLSQTATLLLSAQANKAEIELLAEHLASLLIPALIGLSGCTVLLWLIIDPLRYMPSLVHSDINRLMLSMKLGISVLVVACPCALTIATPTAVMVGTAVGAKHGILIKGASVLETLAQASDIVFDKTGTLTEGCFEVSRVDYTSEFSQERKKALWHMIHAAEGASNSVHPIKLALDSFFERKYFSDKTNPVVIRRFEEVQGSSLRCTFCTASSSSDESNFLIGNRVIFDHDRIALPDDKRADSIWHSQAHSRSALGTQIFVAVDGEVMCSIKFRDKTRERAGETMGLLRTMGKTLWILTGDDDSTAQTVANHVGIEPQNVLSECTAMRKADFIGHLQGQGKVVVMVGDGVNDVLALTRANVGISLSGATNVATDSADVILMHSGGIDDVVSAISLANYVYRRVKCNLAFSIAWNVAVVPIAMGILVPWNLYLPPATAACLMSLSCISIILSSLTLKTWKIPSKIGAGATAERHDLSFRNNKYQLSLRKIFRRAILRQAEKDDSNSLEV